MWLAEAEGAKLWLSVLTELKSRGLEDILIACVDSLKGFPEAIETEYPQCRIPLSSSRWRGTTSIRRSANPG